MDTLASQVYGFSATIAAGLSLGLLFDLYRLWRRATRPQKFVTAVQDILFWVVATPVTYFYLVMGNWAELRFHVFLGLALGLLLYFGVFSLIVRHLVLALMHFIGSFFKTLTQSIWFLVSIPLEGAARWNLARRRHSRPRHTGHGIVRPNIAKVRAVWGGRSKWRPARFSIFRHR
ncbi:MAG: spore cortex biosynthesis protein YabQ [Firmicutes bacterium]|nr:spore cortex biosynthesis protein YabQ [Bacillota bacterium]